MKYTLLYSIINYMKNKICGKREKTTKFNVEKRFWEKVDKTNSCWNWIGSFLKKTGHGQFQTENGMDYAHRFSWKLHFGEIPKGMFVLHKCDNGKCVNPNHLFLGTQKDNMVDMTQKGRNFGMKLNKKEVEKIRKEYKFRKTTAKILAVTYGVCPATIWRVIKGETYEI